jgi:HEAT repeat protein
MPSIFEKLWRIGPAAVVFKAIIVAVAVDALLLMFILLRRTYRARYFARRDARVFEIRQQWEPLIAGDIPYTTWRKKPFELEIIESMALDAFEAAGPEESARLLKFLRTSGLIEKRAFEARRLKGWKRMRALVALGRTRAPEGIPALGEGLRDRSLEIRLAALRGLGRTACPQAAEEILAWLSETGLSVPALPVQSALIQCTAERPQLLLPHVKNARGELREMLGRVLGEVATPSLGSDLLQYAADDLDELRAAAARSMAHTKSGLEIDVLTELIVDPVWFVRLRAAVSLGQLSNRGAAPALVLGLKDANRMVRLRAAEGLVQIPGEMAGIFAQVVATQDRYGLHAYLAALENANLRDRLEHELQSSNTMGQTGETGLQKILETGTLVAEYHGLKKQNRDPAIVSS